MICSKSLPEKAANHPPGKFFIRKEEKQLVWNLKNFPKPQ